KYRRCSGCIGPIPASSRPIALSAAAATTTARNARGESSPPDAVATAPPSVIVKDASGNPVSGVAVTFATAPGNGTVTPTTPVTTGTDGIAAATSWSLGATAAAIKFRAEAVGLPGRPVTFTATGTAEGADDA